MGSVKVSLARVSWYLPFGLEGAVSGLARSRAAGSWLSGRPMRGDSNDDWSAAAAVRLRYGTGQFFHGLADA
jgi:hypothetical protein